MQHDIHDIIINQFTRNLEALKLVLEKGEAFAKEREYDSSLLLQLRAAPDMLPLVKQVQICCDTTKLTASRLSGKTAPAFADEEKTIGELIQRINKTLEYISGFKKEDFSDYTNKSISFPWKPGVHIRGKDYFSSHAIPNFYFHATATYMLLRSAGVKLGKADFLGKQNFIND